MNAGVKCLYYERSKFSPGQVHKKGKKRSKSFKKKRVKRGSSMLVLSKMDFSFSSKTQCCLVKPHLKTDYILCIRKNIKKKNECFTKTGMKQPALVLRLCIHSLFNPRCDFLLPSLMLNGNKMEVVQRPLLSTMSCMWPAWRTGCTAGFLLIGSGFGGIS